VLANEGLAYAYRRDTVKILANVVRATHGQSRIEVLGNGDGARPLQAFVLKQPPLTFVSASNPEGIASSIRVRVDNLEWHEVRNMAFAAAVDRSFVTQNGDDGKTTVAFGDGVHGRRLSTGAANVVASYRNGIGSPGNVAAGQVSLLASRPLGVKDVVNPLPASGGADPETRDQARGNVPLAVMALDRLVSVPDYANFSRMFGGVGKAVAVALAGGVRVTIAGADDIAIENTSDLFRNLLDSLMLYGDPSLPVLLDVRQLLALSLSAKVGLAPDYAWEFVEPVIRANLLDAFGFERTSLARDVYLSQVIACIQGVRGVAWVDIDAFDTLDEPTVLASLAEAGSEDLPDIPGVVQRVRVRPARLDAQGQALPAQLAYFLPNVPDTLLLQEATA
jgi:predicted phage baseplate assembly protein